jgi:hypothetical protein
MRDRRRARVGTGELTRPHTGAIPAPGSALLLRTRSQPVLTRGGARARLRREPPATPTLDRHFDNPPVDLVDPRAPGARGRPQARSRRDGRRVRQRHRRPRPRTVRHGPRQRDAGAPGPTGLSPCLDPTVRPPICPSLSSAAPAAVSARAAPTWRSTARTCSRWLGPPPLPPCSGPGRCTTAAPQWALTERARAEIARRVGPAEHSVAQAARDFGVSRHVAMAAVPRPRPTPRRSPRPSRCSQRDQA